MCKTHPAVIERCPPALDPTVLRLFDDNTLPTAASTMPRWCKLVDVACSCSKHSCFHLCMLRGLGRLCCSASGEQTLTVLISLFQLPKTHVTRRYAAVRKLIEVLVRVEGIQPGRAEVAEVRLAFVADPGHGS